MPSSAARAKHQILALASLQQKGMRECRQGSRHWASGPILTLGVEAVPVSALSESGRLARLLQLASCSWSKRVAAPNARGRVLRAVHHLTSSIASRAIAPTDAGKQGSARQKLALRRSKPVSSPAAAQLTSLSRHR